MGSLRGFAICRTCFEVAPDGEPCPRPHPPLEGEPGGELGARAERCHALVEPTPPRRRRRALSLPNLFPRTVLPGRLRFVREHAGVTILVGAGLLFFALAGLISL